MCRGRDPSGLTIGLYALILPADRVAGAKELAQRIQRSPMVTAGLLRPRADDRNPVSIPWAPSPMVVDFLAGRPLEHARICEVPSVGTAIASKVFCAWSVDLGGLGIEQVRSLLVDLRTWIALSGGQPMLLNLDCLAADRDRDQALLAAVAELRASVRARDVHPDVQDLDGLLRIVDLEVDVAA